MGSLVIVIPIGLLTLIVYFVFSPNVAGWLALIGLAIWNVFALFKSFSVYKSFRKGASISEGELLASSSQPFVASIILIAIICLLLIDINKLHLLWFYPVVNIIFDFIIARRLVKKLDSLRQGPFDNSQSDR